jgi:hypothetical protein
MSLPLYAEESPPLDTLWLGVWVDTKAGLDEMDKSKFLALPGLKLRPLSHLAHSQLLYRLRFPLQFSYDATLTQATASDMESQRVTACVRVQFVCYSLSLVLLFRDPKR